MFSSPRSFLLSLFILLSKLGLGLGFQPPPFDFFGKRALLFYRMNGSTPESLLKRKWGLKRWEGNEKERPDTMRDSEPGFETQEPEFQQESMAPISSKKVWTYQIREATAFGHSDKILQGTMNCSSGCLRQNANDLSLDQIGSIASSERTLGITGTCFDYPLGIDAIENSTSSGMTSSHSLKDLRQLQFAYSSKNACTTSPVKESEAMRKWKEIKQNGFLSHPNGGVPMPEPPPGKRAKRKTKGIDQKRKMETARVEQDNKKMEIAKVEQEKRKMEVAKGGPDNRKMKTAKGGQDKRKMETVKREQDNMFRSAPSSGLLSRISIGIIRRVKNYEEVHAILEDMVRLEKPGGQIQNEFRGQEESESKEITCTTKLSDSTLSI